MLGILGLVSVRCWCGVEHAIPESLHRIQQEAHDEGRSHAVYCPLGHMHVPAGKSKAKLLEEKLAAQIKATGRERQRNDQLSAELEHAEARRRAEKGAKTKLKKRLANGVCPCCSREFQNLKRHMKSKHPQYEAP
jgi:hypothetical protein